MTWRQAKKTVTAVVGALIGFGLVVTQSDPAAITSGEWMLLVTGLATAAGVYKVTNEPEG